MICPKCQKEFLSADKFCPYCGEPIEAAETAVKAEPQEEVKEEVTEEVSEEITEGETETSEEATEEATEEAEASEETVEEIDSEAAKEALAAAADAEKKAKTAVNVLSTLVVVAILVIVALLAMMHIDNKQDAAQTTDATSVTTEIVSETATGEVTTGEAEETEIVQGAIPFEDEFPEDYTMKYPDGFPYSEIDISEYITLGNYKGQTAEVTLPDTMSDEEFEKQLNYFLMQYAELGDPVTDRPAALNDSVVIDYVGTVDGVAFEGGTANDQTAVLGMGQYIPGFEEGIVGMNIGDTKDIHVTFPENYGAEALAGKAAVFKITLKAITENVLPEYNDDFVMSNFGIATVAEFEKELRSMNAEEAVKERNSAILTIITDGSTFKGYPEGAVEDYIYQQLASDMSASTYYGMSVEEYITMYYGMDVPTYEAQVRAMAEGMVEQELAVYAVAKAEGIEVTPEDMAAETANFLEYYGETDLATLCENLGISEELLESSLTFSVVYNKVMNFMKENTTFIVVE